MWNFYLLCGLSINQFNLKYQTSGCADLRIRSAAMARVTGVSGRLARRICKKVLRDGRPDHHHSPFEFVLLTISAIVTIEWGSAAGQIRQAGGTCVDGAPDGDRLLKRLSGAVGLPPNRQIPGVTICPRAPKHRRKRAGVSVSGAPHPAGLCRSARFHTGRDGAASSGRRTG